MAIGKIKGPMLYDNLERQGVNLSFDGNLLHLDVTGRQVGIGTDTPGYTLDVPGNVRVANLTILGNTITSNTGKIGLGTIENIIVKGGANYDIVVTDGQGNLRWGNLNEISFNTDFTGNTIEMGLAASGTFGGNALTFTEFTTVTNAIAELNELLGNITNTAGTEIHVSGNVNSTNVNTQTLYATDIYGTIQTVNQPSITNVGTLLGLTIDGNLTVYGNTTFLGYSDLTIADSILNLHTTANLAPWTSNDGKDIGIKMHYYDDQDSHAALIRANDSGFLEWYSRGREIEGNVFSGNAYGVIKTGEMILANATPTVGANTGALQVYGGVSIGGNLYIADNITANTITVPGISSTAGNIATLYVENFSSGNAVITGGYISALANATITYSNIATLDAGTGYIENFSTANAVITGGYADNYPIGANVAAPGRFTTVVTTDVTTVGGNLVANSGTASNDTTTGALVVIGGAGISGNLNVGNIIVDQINANTGIVGDFYATTSNIGDTVANTAIIGNLAFANTTVTHTDVFVFNSNTAIQVPVGDTSERPTPASGYLRYNTDLPALEYFDGTIWVSVTNTITDQQITGDGSTDTFTLDQDATTVGVIVSINGTLQQPNSAYYVHDGNLITFNEVPEATDIIDVRFLGAAVSLNSTISDDLYIVGNLTVMGNTNISSTYFGNIIPSEDVTYSLGSSSRRWKDLYVSGNTIHIGASTIKVIEGVLLVDDAPIVGGNIGSVYGNTQVAAYLTVNKPTGTYSNANVASYLTANKPTGTYSNTNVAGYLAGNITSGNVFAKGFYYANGMPFVSGTTYSNANVATYLTGNVTAGNVFATGFYYANGMPFVGGSTYNSTDVKSYLNNFDGNIIPSANVAYSLGNETNWWTELWLSSNTIYIGGKPLSVNPSSNVVTYNNQILGGAKFTEATVAPANPTVGDQWYDTDTDVLYEYLDTGLARAWVDITGPVGVAGPEGLQGAQGPAGNDGTSVIILGSAPTFEELPTWGNLTYGEGFIVQATGNLAVYDGSAFQDVGQIKGPKGNTGDTGIGVETAVVTNGNLLVTLSNTYVINAGSVIGPQGEQGTAGNDGADATNYLTFGNLSANANLNMVTGTLSFTGYNGVVVDITDTTANIGLAGNVALTSVTAKFAEPVITGNIPSNYTPDWNLGSIHNYTAIQNFTLNAPINMPIGAAMTIVVTQDGTGSRAMTPNVYYKFASNIRTLSTGANSVDMMNFVRTGANTYLTVLTKGYA